MAVFAAIGVSPQVAFAMPDDFRVFGDDISDRGELGAELQAATGRSQSRGSGVRSTERQGLAEISYGIAPNTEVSAQFPVVWRDGQWRANGVNLEAQYIAPHEKRGIYLGGRMEVARSPAPQGVESRTSFEVRPILGYRDSDWELILNAATRKALGGESRRWKLEPSIKISADAGRGVRLGLEGYSNFGNEGSFSKSDRSSIGLLAIDFRVAKVQINVGVGRSWGADRGGPIVKTVVALDFD